MSSCSPRRSAISRSLHPTAVCALAIGIWAALAGAPAGSSALAQPPKKLVQASLADFAACKRENTALTSIGELKLARSKETVAEKAGEHVWALAIDSKGVVYAATGSIGEIYRIADGKSERFYKSEQPEILCLAVDKSDNLYAGTAPDGLIYRFTPQGDVEVLYDSPESYVWGLAFDSKGTLYAATGENAKLLKITGKGAAEKLFESKVPHLLDIAIDSRDNIYVCTSKNGQVFRIDAAGKAFALLDTEDDEMHAIVIDEHDNVYVCTADGMQQGSGGFERRIRRTGRRSGEAMPQEMLKTDGDDDSGDGDSGDEDGDAPEDEPEDPDGPKEPPRDQPEERPNTQLPPEQPDQPERPQGDAAAPAIHGINFVYKIAPDGMVTSLLRREGVALVSMAYSGGTIYLGTANQGHVLALDSNLQVTYLTQVDQPQVPSLAAAPDGTLYFGAATEGKIYRLANKTAEDGTLTSTVQDMTFPSQWGTIRCAGEAPDGTAVSVATRTGNVAEPDATWSDWSKEENALAGPKIASPVGRFMQYRLRLKSTKGDRTPSVRSVEAYSLPPNYRPTVASIAFPHTASMSNPGPQQPVGRARSRAPQQRSGAAPVRGTIDINWQAEDLNGDTLQFEVSFRSANETTWKLMGDKLRDPRFAWNTINVPDGTYRVKVKADDKRSNAPDRALWAEEISGPVTIDNTAPAVQDLKASTGRDGTVTVTCTLSDAGSSIEDAAYSVGSREWTMIAPQDGIFDGPSEAASFTVSGLEPGEHVILVNVKDAAGNVGSGKTVAVVPAK